MTELPDGWRMATLNDLAAAEPRSITDGPFGSNLTSAHYTESGPRVIRLQNVGDGRFIDNPAHISTSHFTKLIAHDVAEGDLIIASLGKDLPRACLVPSWLGPAIVKADCIRVRLGDNVDPRWALYAMQTPAARRWAARQLHGVGRPRLGLKVIRAIPVPLPPIEEQRRIVDILEDHLSRLDAAEGYVRRALARSRGLIDSALMADRTILESPRVPLADLLAEPLRHGRSVPTADGGFPVLRLTAIRSGRIDLSARKLGAWTAAEASRFLVQRGDFLVARGNGSIQLVGRGGLVIDDPDPVAYPDTAIRIRTRQHEINSSYLALVWDSREVRAQIEQRARTTAGIYKINQADMRSMTIPTPDMGAQLDLLARSSALIESRDRLAAGLTAAQLRVGALRRALLEVAFSGKLTGLSLDPDRVEKMASA